MALYENGVLSERRPDDGENRKRRSHLEKVEKKSKNKLIKKQLNKALAKVQALEEQLRREQTWHNKYHDALEEAGLICGVCLEEPAVQTSLKCCSNRLCQQCEEQVAEKHEACPFCRAYLTTPKQQERKRQQQLLQQQARERAHRQATAAEWSDSDSYDGSDEDCSVDCSDDFDESAHAGGLDTTVLLAAAAEAAAAAHAGPSEDCGVCGSTWLKSSMGQAEALPGMHICRSCWRNIPELSSKPFPPDAAPPVPPSAVHVSLGAGSSVGGLVSGRSAGRQQLDSGSNAAAAVDLMDFFAALAERASVGSQAPTHRGATAPNVSAGDDRPATRATSGTTSTAGRRAEGATTAPAKQSSEHKRKHREGSAGADKQAKKKKGSTSSSVVAAADPAVPPTAKAKHKKKSAAPAAAAAVSRRDAAAAGVDWPARQRSDSGTPKAKHAPANNAHTKHGRSSHSKPANATKSSRRSA